MKSERDDLAAWLRRCMKLRAELNLNSWSYWPIAPAGWLPLSALHDTSGAISDRCDDELVDVSNLHTARLMLNHADTYRGCLWFDATKVSEAAWKIAQSLADYLILDDEHHSQLEWEQFFEDMAEQLNNAEPWARDAIEGTFGPGDDISCGTLREFIHDEAQNHGAPIPTNDVIALWKHPIEDHEVNCPACKNGVVSKIEEAPPALVREGWMHVTLTLECSNDLCGLGYTEWTQTFPLWSMHMDPLPGFPLMAVC